MANQIRIFKHCDTIKVKHYTFYISKKLSEEFGEFLFISDNLDILTQTIVAKRKLINCTNKKWRLWRLLKNLGI